MKKTLDHTSAASQVLKYLLQLIGLALFLGFIYYITLHAWIPLLIGAISKVSYTKFQSNNLLLLLTMYSLFCYFANNFILKLYEPGKTKQLLLSILADLLVLPVGLLLTVLYNNFTVKSLHATIDDVYNIYIITILLVIKEVIAAQIVLKKEKI